MKSILKKLHTIMSEVSYIQKDKKNDFHGYAYASEAAIKGKLHEAMVTHGVLFQLDVLGSTQQYGLGKSQNEVLTNITCGYKFYDIESGEVLEGKFCGAGQDNGDKGIYKAVTGALKYILTSTFMIETGTDPENDEKTSQEPSQSVRVHTLESEPSYEAVGVQEAPQTNACKVCSKPVKAPYVYCYNCRPSKKV